MKTLEELAKAGGILAGVGLYAGVICFFLDKILEVDRQFLYIYTGFIVLVSFIYIHEKRIEKLAKKNNIGDSKNEKK